MTTIRVLIVDDHAMFRDGLRALMQYQTDIELVGEAGDVDTGVELARKLSPDIVLMDMHLHNGSGVNATREILAQVPGTRIIALTMYHDDELVARAFQAGVSGYILKDSRAVDLLQAIRLVHTGGAAVDPSVAARVLVQFRRLSGVPEIESGQEFSEREIKMLQGLGKGLSNRAIAEQLFVSEQTIKNHLSVIYLKLGVANRAGAVQQAIRRGIIDGKS